MTRTLAILLALMAFSCAIWATTFASAGPSAAALQALYAASGERLDHNTFLRPIYLDSSENDNHLEGDLYALVDHPFATFGSALSRPEQWCEVLILHINTKYCHAAGEGAGAVLTVDIGKKYPQPREDAYPIAFSYRLVAAAPDYLEILLEAEKGPLSTSDYRIRLAAVPVEGERTFVHLTYSYAYGLTARLAMKAYLATLGSGKVGFTLTGKQSDGTPEYIGGVRGVVERNTMRYYLALDAYLDTVNAPARTKFESRLRHWFAATERYPRQLHELDKAEYLDMKRGEYRRQQQTP